jgi:hypothetical protein
MLGCCLGDATVLDGSMCAVDDKLTTVSAQTVDLCLLNANLVSTSVRLPVSDKRVIRTNERQEMMDGWIGLSNFTTTESSR